MASPALSIQRHPPQCPSQTEIVHRRLGALLSLSHRLLSKDRFLTPPTCTEGKHLSQPSETSWPNATQFLVVSSGFCISSEQKRENGKQFNNFMASFTQVAKYTGVTIFPSFPSMKDKRVVTYQNVFEYLPLLSTSWRYLAGHGSVLQETKASGLEVWAHCHSGTMVSVSRSFWTHWIVLLIRPPPQEAVHVDDSITSHLGKKKRHAEGDRCNRGSNVELREL